MIFSRQESFSEDQSRLSWDGLDDEASSRKSVQDGLECPVCWEGFNNDDKLPYVLWCGHSLCKGCVIGLPWAILKLAVAPVQLPLFVSCPWCKFLSFRLVWKGKLKYPSKNFSLLWMVENVGGEMRQYHDGLKSEVMPSTRAATTATPEHVVEHQGTRHCQGNPGQAFPYFSRMFSSLENTIIRAPPQPPDVFFLLHKWLVNILAICALVMGKVFLLVLVLFILLYVLPFSLVILVLYFVATLIFAFPSFLMVYFALPSLIWLLRKIVQ